MVAGGGGYSGWDYNQSMPLGGILWGWTPKFQSPHMFPLLRYREEGGGVTLTPVIVF